MADASKQYLCSRIDSLTLEYQICQRKLESKCEALLILSKELDQCRSERDQFKLMSEQLRDRYQMLKRQLTGDSPMSLSQIDVDPRICSNTQSQSLARLLFDTKEINKSLKFENDDLRQKLLDAEGDVKLLREQIARTRVGTSDEGLNMRYFPAHERAYLVGQLESSREEVAQLERDLQQVLDEKEELITERDNYKTMHERQSSLETNHSPWSHEKKVVDVDALIAENKGINSSTCLDNSRKISVEESNCLSISEKAVCCLTGTDEKDEQFSKNGCVNQDVKFLESSDCQSVLSSHLRSKNQQIQNALTLTKTEEDNSESYKLKYLMENVSEKLLMTEIDLKNKHKNKKSQQIQNVSQADNKLSSLGSDNKMIDC